MRKKGGSTDKQHPIVEAIGWIGAAAILLAYALVTFNFISPDGFVYPFLNLIGAVGILIIAEVKKLFQSVVLNAIWAVVALVALVKFWLG